MKREADNLTRGQALYLVRKLQAGRKRSAWHVRATNDSYVVYSMPAPKAVR